MRVLPSKFFSSLLLFVLISSSLFSKNYTWEGVSSSWDDENNWKPKGVPSSVDAVTIGTAGTASPALNVHVSIQKLTISSKTLNLSGFKLSITDQADFNSGLVVNGSIEMGTSEKPSDKINFNGTSFGDNNENRVQIEIVSKQFQLNGSVFFGKVTITKVGPGNNFSNGGNTFHKPVTITNNSTSSIRLASNTGDTFKDSAVFNRINTGSFQIAFSGTNSFEGPYILLNNANSSGKITFCESSASVVNIVGRMHFKSSGGGTGFSNNIPVNGIVCGGTGGVLNLGATASLFSTEADFSSSNLYLSKITQKGNLIQSISVGTQAQVTLDNCAFDAKVIIKSGGLVININTFNKVAEFIKTGNINNNTNATAAFISKGGNIFKDSLELNNAGAGPIRLANITGDVFEGFTKFKRTSTGTIHPAYNGLNIFKANIEMEGEISFHQGKGTVRLDGTSDQIIKGEQPNSFRYVLIGKTSGSLFLQAPIAIQDTLHFASTNQARVIEEGNPLPVITFGAGAKVLGANNKNFIDGPARKTGTAAFNFPIGKNGIYRPFEINTIGASTTFEVEYSTVRPSIHKVKSSDGFLTIGSCDYWKVTNLIAGTTAKVKMSISEDSCIKGKSLKLARAFNNEWVAENVTLTGSPARDMESSSAMDLSLNVPNIFTTGYSGLSVNVQNLTTSTYDVIQEGKALASGLKTGRSEVKSTFIDPVIPSVKSTLVFDIKPSESNEGAKVEVDINGNLQITEVRQKTTEGTEVVAKGFYSYSEDSYKGKELIFYSEKKENFPVKIITNLIDGIAASNTFEVKGLSGVKAELAVYKQGQATPVFTSSNTATLEDKISFNNIPSTGLYLFELKLTETTTPSPKVKVYKGQFLK